MVGGRVGYQAWQEFFCVSLELVCYECLGQLGIWTSLDGELCHSAKLSQNVVQWIFVLSTQLVFRVFRGQTNIMSSRPGRGVSFGQNVRGANKLKGLARNAGPCLAYAFYLSFFFFQAFIIIYLVFIPKCWSYDLTWNCLPLQMYIVSSQCVNPQTIQNIVQNAFDIKISDRLLNIKCLRLNFL